MVRLLKQWLSGEKGQALSIVLCLLAIGGLTIAVSLNYATTNLKGSRIVEEKMAGVYAAGAGVEHTLWSLKNGISPLTQLSENISRMTVNIQTNNEGTYTLYLGELIEPSEHSDYLGVSGNLTWVSGNTYRYVITVTWQAQSGEPPIKLLEVGARIPIGDNYTAGSAASFVGNLSTGEPVQTQDESGTYLLNWILGTPRPTVSENETVRTQTFYLTGSGSQAGHYAWVVAQRTDIGQVGEITGTLYEITATARRPADGRTTAEIEADVIIKDDGTVNILSWKITK